MGHAGMAETAVRYLRSVGAATAAAPSAGGPAAAPTALPGAAPLAGARAALRAVGPDERAPVDQGEFRGVLGRFATGVTLVTAACPDGPAGFACQSFVSLSLEPPLVAFMVGRTSTTWPRIARAGVFCANVLTAGQSPLCRQFAVSGSDKFAGVDWTPAPVSGSPRIGGASAWIDCAIHAVHTGGDHLVVVGRVVALGATDGDDNPDAPAGPENPSGPLLFYRGGFGTFAPFGPFTP
ncbi:flavin reductase family protein [Streptomyces sp. NPDC088910]|uniref:flavin reductase family protein n=1 Tax=Streptomyces sp. NPDC088910 TaxID=3365911 RepID=UPI003810CEA5